MKGLELIAKWPELRSLSAEQVLAGTRRCAGEEREALLKFLLYLSEVERRRLYEVANKRTLWEFLEESLGFTVCETRLRFHSAKLLLRFPIVAEYLADGRLSMTTLVVMKDHLTSANVRDECEKASGKSKAHVERQVAEKVPTVLDFGMLSEERAPSITEVPAAATSVSVPGSSPDLAAAPSGSHAAHGAPSGVPSAPGKTFFVQNAPSKASVKALTATQSVLSLSLHEDERADLEELRDLLSEIFPDRDLRSVVVYSIREVRKRILKKRGKIPVKSRAPAGPETTPEENDSRSPVGSSLADDGPAPETATSSSPVPEAAASPPSPAKTASPKRYALKQAAIPGDAAIPGRNRDRAFTRESIPALTARLVWLRDDHRCQRKLKGGGICGSTYRCQIDHIRSVADGGTNDPSNLQVHCRRHNLQRARERFGSARIERAIARRRASRADTPSPRAAGHEQEEGLTPAAR